jgi:hypothetical protein
MVVIVFFKHALDIFLTPIYIIAHQSLIHHRLHRHRAVHQPDSGGGCFADDAGVG